MISGFENNSLGSREVERLLLEESGGKALSGKGSSLELRPWLEGGSKDPSVLLTCPGPLLPTCPGPLLHAYPRTFSQSVPLLGHQSRGQSAPLARWVVRLSPLVRRDRCSFPSNDTAWVVPGALLNGASWGVPATLPSGVT